jgi:hypothetical protein
MNPMPHRFPILLSLSQFPIQSQPQPDPMRVIGSDARLLQLLSDLPIEKLQSLIDAKAAHN